SQHGAEPRKKNRNRLDKDVMMEAVKSVLAGGLSVKQSAIRFQIPPTTSIKYIEKCEGKDINWNEATIVDVPKMGPNYNVRQIFSPNEEEMLAGYLIKCARLHHGLPPMAVSKLAHEFALANHKAIPQTLTHKKTAGKD
ncbi:hypothetical protein HHI36_019906, partial [Cryptolaemus montrouzieri]